MLTDLALLATDVLSSDLWPSMTVPTPPPRLPEPVITPGEPATLVLALVGAATVGVYVALRGLRHARIKAAPTSALRVSELPPTRSGNVHDERPKRGAA
jgi:hypothetical protein